MKKGWIKIDRKILDHDIWNSDEPFDNRSAWIDLLLLANFKDAEMTIRRTGKKQTIKRGQRHTSRKELARRWKWSVGKVDRFLGTLRDTGMVDIHGTTHGTLLTLVNYGKYQGRQDTDDTANDTTDDTPDGTSDGTARGTRYKNDIKNDIKRMNQENKKQPASRIGFYDTELED